MNKALVVVDMQEKFIGECNGWAILPHVTQKIKQRMGEGYEVFMTLDKGGGKIVDEVSAVCGGAKIYKKHSYGCGELILELKREKPDKVEFIGVCTDICVITNVLATMAFLPFSEIAVDGDCCCALRPENHFAALQIMKSCNVKILNLN